jgi:hypothetical protein
LLFYYTNKDEVNLERTKLLLVTDLKDLKDILKHEINDTKNSKFFSRKSHDRSSNNSG